ncbi:hypothetical protein OJAV_G00197590 [Oryzias javanicus]|uniref:Cystatin domain-containing protein n=1 Tax=Oryzias javanicus TaxID=123683 RepID=A0A3S2PR84_ORYJA|nr:hypothetical protein OJAV_G00197590 [Oryzias javanicus]
MSCGGLSETLDADPDIQKIADQVKDDLEKMADKCFLYLQAIQYRFQIVAGTLYYIKVYAFVKEDESYYYHLKVIQKISGNLELLAFQDGHDCDDPIEPFE